MSVTEYIQLTADLRRLVVAHQNAEECKLCNDRFQEIMSVVLDIAELRVREYRGLT